MAHLPVTNVLLYNDDNELNFKYEDLRFNRNNINWISRWVNDSQKFGYGVGHFEDVIEKDIDYGYKVRSGCSVQLDNTWYDIISVFDNGSELSSVRLIDNPEMSKVNDIRATEINTDHIRLRHINADTVYNGPSVGNHLHGTGKDGALVVSSLNMIINKYTRIVGNVIGGDQIINVVSTVDFHVGDEILIMQSQYANTDTAYYGNFEFHYIGEIINSTTIKTQWKIGLPFISDAPNDSITCNPPPCSGLMVPNSQPLPSCRCSSVPNSRTAQIIRIPHYSSVRIHDNGSLIAKKWNGNDGGFLGFRCNGLVDIGGSIDVTGLGFRGSYKPTTIYFRRWEKVSVGSFHGRIATFESVVGINTHAGWGSTGEGCHGYGRYAIGTGIGGIGGAGGCGYCSNYIDLANDYAPGAGGSYGSLGGGAFREFTHRNNVNGRIITWKTYTRSYPSYTICDNKLMQMTLGTGGGGTMYRTGGSGSGGILLFCKEMLIRESGRILACGALGKVGSNTHQCSGGGNGSGGPIVISVSRKLVNYGIINCGGGHYNDGKAGMGGYGGDGRIVWDVPNFDGNYPINYGTIHTPTTIREAIRWGKLPLNSIDTLLIHYYTMTTHRNNCDVSNIKRLDSILVTYTYPHLISNSEIKLVLMFNNRDWVYWNGNNWVILDDIGSIGKLGMSIPTLQSLTSKEYMSFNGFTQNVKNIGIAASIMTGIRLESPELFKVTINGKKRSWRLWNIAYPRNIETVDIGKVKIFNDQS